MKVPQKLPNVLSRDETLRLLRAVREPTRRMALQTIYGLGLRLNEALRLEVVRQHGFPCCFEPPTTCEPLHMLGTR